MSAQPKPRDPLTFDSVEVFLEWEFQQPDRHEYHAGRALAMSGSNDINHADIGVNIIVSLGGSLKKPCRVKGPDHAVRVETSDRYVYPDAFVVCGEPDLIKLKDGKAGYKNPIVVFEIPSETTEDYDRTEKFGYYQQLPSLKHYVLVSRTRHHVQVMSRQDDGTWTVTNAAGLDAVAELPAIDVVLPLTAVYDSIEFPSPSLEQFRREAEAEHRRLRRAAGEPVEGDEA